MAIEEKIKEYDTFTAFLKDNLEASELEDMCKHGIDAGFTHLIYYSDTVPIYEHFKDEIWEMLLNDTEDLGAKNVYEMIASFGRAKNVSSYETHANLMTWYAAERIAASLTNNF